MTKLDLITFIAKKADITVVKAVVVVETVFESMSEAMKSGERVEIRHFGTFSMRDYKSYEGRNPRTGETIRVEKKRMPFFKPGKPLADRIKSSTDEFGN